MKHTNATAADATAADATAAATAEVRSGLDLTKAPSAIFVHRLHFLPISPHIHPGLASTDQSSRKPFSQYTSTNPYQVCHIVNSIKDVKVALTQGVTVSLPNAGRDRT